MRVEPIKRYTPRKVGLIFPSWNAMTIVTMAGEQVVHGRGRCYDKLKELEDHVLYVPGGLRGLLYTTGSKSWQAEVWRGRATAMTLDGTKVKVRSLRRVLDGNGTPLEMYSDLLGGLEWLANQGVSPGAISSMAWNLWRSTLSEGVEFAFDAKVGRAAFYGGRQEAGAPKTYSGYVSLDISSAYPHSMSARPYAATLREVDKGTTLDPTMPGLARATVFVDSQLPYAPLPVRIAEDMIQFQTGVLKGTWTWGELAAARDLGCTVKVERCWAPNRLVNPFEGWWDLVRTGRREVTPGAEKLVKAVSNSLWGMFGMTGDDRGVIRWSDDLGEAPIMVARGAKKMPQANTAHVAAETTSRVRVRMLLEGLYGDHVAPIHVDTDGIIVRQSSLARRDLGEGPGSWRIKHRMPKVELRGPQWYRYTCGPLCGSAHDRWHYVASGMSSSMAQDAFEKVGALTVTVGGVDSVLKQGHTSELDLRRARHELSEVEVALYGQPITTASK